jgi:hypothetical protein
MCCQSQPLSIRTRPLLTRMHACPLPGLAHIPEACTERTRDFVIVTLFLLAAQLLPGAVAFFYLWVRLLRHQSDGFEVSLLVVRLPVIVSLRRVLR